MVEQLAELQTYIDTIKGLASRVNRPVTNLLTFIAGFGLCHRLINPLSKLSKLSAWNLTFSKLLGPSELWELSQLPRLPELLEFILFFFADLVTRSADLVTALLHNPGKNVQLKQLNLQLAEKSFLQEMATTLSSMVQERSASPETAGAILQKLHQDWRKQYQDSIETAKLDIYEFNKLIIDIEYYLLLYMILISASQYIVSPLLLKIFPHGVYPLKSPYFFRKNQIPPTSNEMSEIINAQRVIKRNLEINRGKITALSRIIALVGFLIIYSLDDSPPPYGLYKFLGDFLSCTQWIALVPLSLFSTALDGIFDDLYQLYLEFNKEERMQVVKHSLNSLSRGIQLPNWDRRYGEDVGACYFHLSIFRRNIQRKREFFQDIPISRLVKELVCVLYHYKCNVIAYNKHELTLLLDKPLSGFQVNEITASFKNRLASIKNKHKLTLQLDENRPVTCQEHLIPVKKQTVAPLSRIDADNVRLSRVTKKNKPVIKITVQVSPDRLALPENYKWHSGTYSNRGDSKVVKIRGAHNLFSLFKLKPEDFPSGQKEAYHHFKNIITTNAHIVPKKDSQGIVSTRTPVKDAQGRWFTAKHKAKALGGAYGNIRVYARQEDDNQGHRLLVFNTVKLRSH